MILRSVVLALALFMLPALMLQAAGKAASEAKTPSLVPEPVFDFGHIGIDYDVYHRYPVVNRSSDTLRITDVVAHCDCSSAFTIDSILAPGDSTTINLRYNTKNFYGPQNKLVTVTTVGSEEKTIDLFYLSIIGQWFEGVKPEPLAAFFLPPHKVKKITIPNPSYEQLAITEVDALDDYYDVIVVTSEASRNQNLEVEIRPAQDLGPGTWQSSVSLTIDPGEFGEAIRLTIPIKIVRY